MITYTVEFKPDTISTLPTSDTLWYEPNGKPNTYDFYCEAERDASALERALDADDACISYTRVQ
jgi:hypothetical protein